MQSGMRYLLCTWAVYPRLIRRNLRIVGQAPRVILNLSTCLLCVKKVNQDYVGAGCHEIEAEGFQEGFLGEEDRCLLLLDLLVKPMRSFE